MSASSSSDSRVATTGSLPTNSGIKPYLIKSLVSHFFMYSSYFISFLSTSFVLNPTVDVLILLSIIFSSPSNAPPHINKIFLVFTLIYSCCGCFLPPAGGTFASVPSIILRSACCTPSPDTSRVILTFSPFLVILSISSMYIIPISVFLTSPPAAVSNFNTTFSTSSPT